MTKRQPPPAAPSAAAEPPPLQLGAPVAPGAAPTRARRKITLRTGEHAEVMGYDVGSRGVFFAWRELEHPTAVFHLTHSPTGVRLCDAADITLAAAVAARLEEEPGLDLDFTDPRGERAAEFARRVGPLLRRFAAEELVTI